MMNRWKLAMNRRPLVRVGLLCLALLATLGACTSDSPSEPSQNPGTPPGTTPPNATFTVSITANPPLLAVNDDEPSTIRVQVRRSDNGQSPPNGSTVVVTTTLGDFGTPGSGNQSAVVTLTGGVGTILLYAGDTPGAAIVQARVENSTAQARVEIRGADTFFLSFVEPSVGSPQGGDVVNIVGGGFMEPVRVTFGGVVAQVRSVSNDRVRVVVPPSIDPPAPGNTQAVNVTVTINLNEEDEASDTLNSGFVYAPGGGSVQQPQIFSLTPATGVNEGGTRVLIRGEGFSSPVQVFFGVNDNSGFNGVEATVESVTANEIVVITPSATGFGQANQNALVDVLVRNLETGFSTVAGGAFRYGSQVIITSVAPTMAIPYDSQPRVTIFGQGFEAPVAVSLGGVAAQPVSVSGTEIVVKAGIPVVNSCSDITGPISVTNINSGTGDTADGLTFTYSVSSAIIANITPNQGSANGTQPVTITGQGFTEPVRVFFDDKGATIVSVAADGTRVDVIAPTFSDFGTEACDDDGDGTQGERFVPTSVDVTVRSLQTDCDDTFTQSFTYLPSDTSCRGDMGEEPVMDPQCNDGIDNDGDGLIDFPEDPGCESLGDNTESPNP